MFFLLWKGHWFWCLRCNCLQYRQRQCCSVVLIMTHVGPTSHVLHWSWKYYTDHEILHWPWNTTMIMKHVGPTSHVLHWSWNTQALLLMFYTDHETRRPYFSCSTLIMKHVGLTSHVLNWAWNTWALLFMFYTDRWVPRTQKSEESTSLPAPPPFPTSPNGILTVSLFHLQQVK